MNIVVINNLPRFPGTSRWDFELVRYEDFICHASHRVSYIINANGRSGITAAAGSYRLYQLARLNDVAAYRPILSEIVAQLGPIDRLIVFSENLQDAAAALREEFGIAGNLPAVNRLGRDKILMKQKVAARGLRVPRYLPLHAGQGQAACAFADEVGFPLILKPIDGASSSGVKKILDVPQLRQELEHLPAGPWDLEEFIDGELLHIDGLVDLQGRVSFIVPSRYVNNCLDFTFGAPLGAVMMEPGSALHDRVCRFSIGCIEAIGLHACPFHLELFHTGAGELVFLEVGARVGGADVPYVIHKSTGVNLFEAWVDMIMGKDVKVDAPVAAVGGWLMFPRPSGLPLRVRSVTGFEGKLASLYRQLIPRHGDVLENESGYCSMQSGRFLFSAETAADVTRDMQRVIREFSITTVQP